MSMATSLEKRIKDAAKNLASGGSPMPVNVIRNHEEPPTPTPTMWTATFANPVKVPVVDIQLPSPVEIEDEQLINLDNYAPEPSSGDEGSYTWVFDEWYVGDIPAGNKYQMVNDTTFTAHYTSTPVGPEPSPTPWMGAIMGAVGSISIWNTGKGGERFDFTASVLDSGMNEIASGSLAADQEQPLVLTDEAIVAGTYTVHLETEEYYWDETCVVEAVE